MNTSATHRGALTAAEPRNRTIRDGAAAESTPSEWEFRRVSDIVATPITDGPHLTPRFTSEGIPFLSVNNLVDNRIDTASLRYISLEDHREYSRKCRPQKWDVLIGKAASVGKVAIVDFDWEFNIWSPIAVIRVGPPNLPLYVFYALQAPAVSRQIEYFTNSSSQGNIGMKDIGRLVLAMPPPDEQHTITEALSNVDELLAALDALIAKKRAIKRAAMQQLLTGRARLPGFSKKWNSARLGDITQIAGGATPSTQVAGFWDGSIPWCTPTDITREPGKYLRTTARTITREGLDSCGAALLPSGALLLCSRATIGEVKIANVPVCTNQGFQSLVCRDSVDNEFLYYVILANKDSFIERAAGSTFLEIGRRDIASVEFLLPALDEQSAVATVLSDMDAEIAALERRREKTRAIKLGMMQQLLTGRIRLIAPPETLEAFA